MAQYNGTSAADRLSGGAENDLLMGLAGNDTMGGGTGNDTLNGGAGDDAVDGGAGVDTYVLSLGRCGVVVTSTPEGALVLRPTPGGMGGNFGIDTVSGVEFFKISTSTGTVTVAASEMMARYNSGYSHAATAGNDKLLGGYGADTMNGLGGNDTLEGSNGDDTLNGNAGTDVLRGGDGADLFVFNAGEGGRDRVEDFQVGLDRLQLNPASGYAPTAAEGVDAGGARGTWVTWGAGNDTAFLAGVTGVGADALFA